MACSALKGRYREILRGNCRGVRFVFLNAARGELASRLTSRAGHFAGVSILDSQLATLEEPSAEEALTIDATLGTISPLTELGEEWPPIRSFRAYAALERPDPRLRPGMNWGMDIIVNRIPNAISVPAKAVFTHAGQPVVYLANQRRYTAVPVQLLARNPDEVAVSGISAGAIVALADPEKSDAKP